MASMNYGFGQIPCIWGFQTVRGTLVGVGESADGTRYVVVIESLEV